MRGKNFLFVVYVLFILLADYALGCEWDVLPNSTQSISFVFDGRATSIGWSDDHVRVCQKVGLGAFKSMFFSRVHQVESPRDDNNWSFLEVNITHLKGCPFIVIREKGSRYSCPIRMLSSGKFVWASDTIVQTSNEECRLVMVDGSPLLQFGGEKMFCVEPLIYQSQLVFGPVPLGKFWKSSYRFWGSPLLMPFAKMQEVIAQYVCAPLCTTVLSKIPSCQAVSATFEHNFRRVGIDRTTSLRLNVGQKKHLTYVAAGFTTRFFPLSLPVIVDGKGAPFLLVSFARESEEGMVVNSEVCLYRLLQNVDGRVSLRLYYDTVHYDHVAADKCGEACMRRSLGTWIFDLKDLNESASWEPYVYRRYPALHYTIVPSVALVLQPASKCKDQSFHLYNADRRLLCMSYNHSHPSVNERLKLSLCDGVQEVNIPSMPGEFELGVSTTLLWNAVVDAPICRIFLTEDLSAQPLDLLYNVSAEEQLTISLRGTNEAGEPQVAHLKMPFSVLQHVSGRFVLRNQEKMFHISLQDGYGIFLFWHRGLKQLQAAFQAPEFFMNWGAFALKNHAVEWIPPVALNTTQPWKTSVVALKKMNLSRVVSSSTEFNCADSLRARVDSVFWSNRSKKKVVTWVMEDKYTGESLGYELYVRDKGFFYACYTSSKLQPKSVVRAGSFLQCNVVRGMKQCIFNAKDMMPLGKNPLSQTFSKHIPMYVDYWFREKLVEPLTAVEIIDQSMVAFKFGRQCIMVSVTLPSLDVNESSLSLVCICDYVEPMDTSG